MLIDRRLLPCRLRYRFLPQCNGSCVETDKDGDNVFTTFGDKNHYLMGGQGKYKGITGTVPYTVVEIHETVGGRTAFIVNHKATWEIK